MTTAAKAARTFGLTHLSGELGEAYSFGGIRFNGIEKRPEPADRGVVRGFADGPEHDFEVSAEKSQFRGNLPVPGNHIERVKDHSYHRIVSVLTTPGSHKLTLLVVQPKPAK